MKNMNKVMTVLVTLMMSASAAMAQGTTAKDPTAAPGIDQRIVKQKKRISKKLAKGKITQDQANKLNSDVDAVQANETQMKQDGKLTKEERKNLRQQLNTNSQEIKAAGAKAPSTGN